MREAEAACQRENAGRTNCVIASGAVGCTYPTLAEDGGIHKPSPQHFTGA